jgi:hypothetical protein
MFFFIWVGYKLIVWEDWVEKAFAFSDFIFDALPGGP